MVKVLATQGCVSIGCLHLEHTTRDFQNGNVESSTTEIVDSDCLAVRRLHTESQCCCGRFVNDAQDIQTRDFSSILRGLPLRIVEVRWYCHDSLLHAASEMALRCLLHLPEDESTNLAW